MKSKILFIASLVFILSSCEEICTNALVENCHDVPGTGDCDAQYKSWFFDESSKSCKQISYMGCEETGFATEAECMECECVPEDHCPDM